MLTEIFNWMKNKEVEPPQDYKIFVDLDGVLVDFERGVEELLGGYSEHQYETDPNYRTKMWNAVRHYQKHFGRFWLDLEPMADAAILWKYVLPYSPEILTATGTTETDAGVQKKMWVEQQLGHNVTVNVVQHAKEKAKYAAPNHILIDDKEKAIGPWKTAGGIGILHTSAANTIAQLKELGI